MQWLWADCQSAFLLFLIGRAKVSYEDRGGPGIIAVLDEFLVTPYRAVYKIIPDEKERYRKNLDRARRSRLAAPLILTTGWHGTITPRDVTPEATEAGAHFA